MAAGSTAVNQPGQYSGSSRASTARSNHPSALSRRSSIDLEGSSSSSTLGLARCLCRRRARAAPAAAEAADAADAAAVAALGEADAAVESNGEGDEDTNGAAEGELRESDESEKENTGVEGGGTEAAEDAVDSALRWSSGESDVRSSSTFGDEGSGGCCWDAAVLATCRSVASRAWWRRSSSACCCCCCCCMRDVGEAGWRSLPARSSESEDEAAERAESSSVVALLPLMLLLL